MLERDRNIRTGTLPRRGLDGSATGATGATQVDYFHTTTMSKSSKLLARLLSGSADASFTFEELRSVLLRLGFEQRTPGGSHYTFSHPEVRSILTVPKRKPLKPIYVKKARALITENRLADDGSS